MDTIMVIELFVGNGLCAVPSATFPRGEALGAAATVQVRSLSKK